ncbi:hypothetical protein OHB93_12835 [Microbacterium sp. No. 7]|uniref:hypothetical protein n=1 Tax=Microbacterium sp. No. 7 TaxID=1714373 RepID=UPI000886AFC3|nr:hypothetical protein SAMN04488590_2686 [Microbacterium sp. 77mftsu3.1]
MTPSPAHPIPAPFASIGVALIPEQRTGWWVPLITSLSRPRAHRTTAQPAHH